MFALLLALLFSRFNLVPCKLDLLVQEKANIRVLIHNLPPVIVVKWNSTSGHPAGAVSGFAPTFLELISRRFGFTYSWVPLGRNVFTDSTPTMKGFLDYVLDGEADLILTGILPIADRNRKVDFTTPIFEGPFSIMIPFPESIVDKNALSKPFQSEVWICMLAAFILVASVWNLIHWLFAIFLTSKFNPRDLKIFIPFEYVLTVLFSQGNYCHSRYQAIRLLAGTWCLATLVLVPAYSGNLLSYIVSPTVKPVINSIHDIPNVPGLSAAVDRNLAAEAFLIQARNADSTVFKNTVSAIDKILFRCNTSAACIEKVLQGTHVYIHGKPVIDEFILDDLIRSKRCRFAIAKEPVAKGFLKWATAKRSPYFDFINTGILELDAYGLSNYWREKFNKRATKCLDGYQRTRDKHSKHQTRLSWPTFATTFILLGVGYSLALLAFVSEQFFQYLFTHIFVVSWTELPHRLAYSSSRVNVS